MNINIKTDKMILINQKVNNILLEDILDEKQLGKLIKFNIFYDDERLLD